MAIVWANGERKKFFFSTDRVTRENNITKETHH
jgi:hypothetical protein